VQLLIMIKTISFLMGLLVSQWTMSYGDLGHKTVAALAWTQLTPYAKQNVERILGVGKAKFIKSSTWADRIKSNDQFNYLKPMHYVNLPESSNTYDRKRDCDKDKCIVEAIKTFSLIAKTGTKKQQKLALKMLVHLIGDIHQPLHAGLKKDRGGNWYKIQYQNKTISLHKFWDKQLVESITRDWQALANIIALKEIKVPVLSPEIWAQESHKITTEFVYQAKENQKVKRAYLKKAQIITETQLGKAGWRLAMWLNKLW
jgi:hypothetical protein